MDKIKIFVTGATGIIGQHMMLSEPVDVEGSYGSKTSPSPWVKCDLEDDTKLYQTLRMLNPDVIINLAGENRVDEVEKSPQSYYNINTVIPSKLANWCEANDKRMLQVSTQGVFSGKNPTYSPEDATDPITAYGRQKAEAEANLEGKDHVRIARLTFVLGVRPFQGVGRRNPFEDMIEKKAQLQVDDHFFSPVFAHDAAKVLWNEAKAPSRDPIIHVGIPMRSSRFSVAADLKYHSHGIIKGEIRPVSHEYFEGIAPRPEDTTWSPGSKYFENYEDGLISAFLQWKKLDR